MLLIRWTDPVEKGGNVIPQSIVHFHITGIPTCLDSNCLIGNDGVIELPVGALTIHADGTAVAASVIGNGIVPENWIGIGGDMDTALQLKSAWLPMITLFSVRDYRYNRNSARILACIIAQNITANRWTATHPDTAARGIPGSVIVDIVVFYRHTLSPLIFIAS